MPLKRLPASVVKTLAQRIEFNVFRDEWTLSAVQDEIVERAHSAKKRQDLPCRPLHVITRPGATGFKRRDPVLSTCGTQQVNHSGQGVDEGFSGRHFSGLALMTSTPSISHGFGTTIC